MADEPRLLPLFPLHAVLFPHMEMPLRIFEPRYRQMLEFCQAQDGMFGVVLIRSGSEVGGPAQPFEVGTMAHIDAVQPRPDGTLAVTITGQRRFRLAEVVQNRPYMVGLVQPLDEVEGGDLRGPMDEAVTLAQNTLRRMLGLNGEWSNRVPLPRDPARLSYALAERLPLDVQPRQELLEARTTFERLMRELPLLRHELERADGLLAQRNWLASLVLN